MYVNHNSNNNIMIITINTIMIPNKLEQGLSIWYRTTLVKSSTDQSRL